MTGKAIGDAWINYIAIDNRTGGGNARTITPRSWQSQTLTGDVIGEIEPTCNSADSVKILDQHENAAGSVLLRV